jgi:hypothetical protein
MALLEWTDRLSVGVDEVDKGEDTRYTEFFNQKGVS